MTAPTHRHRSSHHRAAPTEETQAPQAAPVAPGWHWEWNWTAQGWAQLWDGYHAEADPVDGSFQVVQDGYTLEVVKPRSPLTRFLVAAFVAIFVLVCAVAFVAAVAVGLFNSVSNGISNEPPRPTTTTVAD